MSSLPSPSDGPRAVVDAHFPADGPREAQLRFLINYAVLAPSVFNTQPWRFRLDGEVLHLVADRSRQMTALDPEGRELVVSCGAALFHLRVAARHFGLEPAVETFPDRSDPDHLAAVSIAGPHRPTDDDAVLFRGLSLRHTNRRAFAETPVPFEAAWALERAAHQEGARLAVLDAPEDRDAVAALVAEGIVRQAQDPAIAEEMGRWLRPATDPRRDGVPDDEQGEWDRRSDSRMPSSVLASRKRALVRESPAVLVLTTATDDPPAWLAAGQALAHVLLVAADRGLFASYVNQPVEVATLRSELARLTGGGFPQVVFRVGYPQRREGTPRRSVSDVME